MAVEEKLETDEMLRMLASYPCARHRCPECAKAEAEGLKKQRDAVEDAKDTIRVLCGGISHG